jgi:hypothetical protein
MSAVSLLVAVVVTTSLLLQAAKNFEVLLPVLQVVPVCDLVFIKQMSGIDQIIYVDSVLS